MIGRRAWRQLARAPVASATAIVVQGLGIAGTLVVLALANGVHQKRPSGVGMSGEEIVEARRVDPESWAGTFPYQTYEAVRDESATLSDVAATIGPFAALFVQAGDVLEGARVGLATSNHLRVLGVRPVAGRAFTPEDERVGAAPVCLLSERLVRRLGLTGRVPGATVVSNERTLTVVGTLPDAFRGNHDWQRIEIWLPVGQYSFVAPHNPEYQPLSVGSWVWSFGLVGRLAPGASPDAAARELTALQRQVVQQWYPDVDVEAQRVTVDPLLAFAHHERRRFVGTAVLLALPAGLVLAMTVLNVAGLGLALALRRQRDVAIRLSVGASPRGIVLARLAEGLALAPFAAGVGLVVALGLLDLLASVVTPRYQPLVEAATLGSVWTPAFVLAVSLATALASSLLPAWSAGRTAPFVILRGGDWTRRRSLGARRALLVGQAALATLLAVAAAGSARSLWRAQSEPPGFDPRGLSVTSVDPLSLGYDKPEALRFARRLLGELNAPPRDRVATVSRMTPVQPIVRGPMAIADPRGGADRPVGTVRYDEVAPSYFDVLAIPVVAGRAFQRYEGRQGAPEIVVNATAARRWPWPGGIVLGSRVRLGREDVPHTVVGVVGDVRSDGVLAPPPPFAYLPLFQRTEQNVFDHYGFAVHLRRGARPGSARHPVVEAVRRLDPRLAVGEPRAIGDLIEETLPLEAMLEGLASAAAALTLAIVALGLYGSASQIAAERTREFGVRLALGARPGALASQVLRAGLVDVGVGLAAGVLAAAALAPLIARSLNVFLSVDAFVVTGVAGLVLGVGLAALSAPALRALVTDPAATLRLPAETV